MGSNHTITLLVNDKAAVSVRVAQIMDQSGQTFYEQAEQTQHQRAYIRRRP